MSISRQAIISLVVFCFIPEKYNALPRNKTNLGKEIEGKIPEKYSEKNDGTADKEDVASHPAVLILPMK